MNTRIELPTTRWNQLQGALVALWMVVIWCVPPSVLAAPSDASSEVTLDQAMANGDLSTARELATEARQANPSAETWADEAQVLEQLGDFEGAAKAFRAQRDALPAEDKAGRAAATANLERVEEAARGVVRSEPKSVHREELDKAWAPAVPSPKQAVKRVMEGPVDDKPKERIVTKWYFWVTVAAIAASVVAVTVISVRAAGDDDDDSLGLTRRPTGPFGPSVIRF